MACAVLAALLGTYLDLYFVGKGLYYFPHRLLPEIFSINIVFTLIVLPILTIVILGCLSQVNSWGRAGIILFISLMMPILEILAEQLGLFVHSDQWKHLYSFFGYLLFLIIISRVYFYLKKEMDKIKGRLQANLLHKLSFYYFLLLFRFYRANPCCSCLIPKIYMWLTARYATATPCGWELRTVRRLLPRILLVSQANWRS